MLTVSVRFEAVSLEEAPPLRCVEDVATKLKALERENRELRQANEILRKASAYFAQA